MMMAAPSTIQRHRTAAALAAAALAACSAPISGAGPQAPAPQRSSYQRYAPIDLTGIWVSVVTEDWAVRMIAPPKGDFVSLPLTKAAQDAANRADMRQVEA